MPDVSPLASFNFTAALTILLLLAYLGFGGYAWLLDELPFDKFFAPIGSALLLSLGYWFRGMVEANK